MTSLVLNVRGGVKICVPGSIDEATTYILLEQEDWMEDEIRFVRHCIQPGMRVVDVGANHGVYTAALAAAVGPSGRVWAFEPTASPAKLLQQTLDLNGFGHAILTQAAISDRPGTLSLVPGSSSELNKSDASSAVLPGAHRVRAVTLDEISIIQDWQSIDFLKIDVEGHEPQVIEGGRAYLTSSSPLVMIEVKERATFSFEAVELLQSMNYSLYRLVPGIPILTPWPRDEELDGFQLNIFACKEDRAARLAAGGFLVSSSPRSRKKPQAAAWIGFSRTAAYARSRTAWSAKPGLMAADDDKVYFDGLASFAMARDPALGASDRYGWLRRAYDRVCEALGEEDSLSRVVSYARLAADLGLRESAVEALEQAIERLGSEGARALEPFLAPSRRHEDIASGGLEKEWLECALVEQYEKLRAFSSLYGAAHTKVLLEPVLRSPFASAESERRRQLTRMRERAQHGPEAHPLLRDSSPENLNPEYWCGSGMQS
jgi:FkbM family methyltransferase